MTKKKYDISSKIDNFSGFYEWNKPVFYVKKKDHRYKDFVLQKKTDGFTDEETWSLYNNIALFITPRLKRFIEIIKETGSYPASFSSSKEWVETLNKILFSFETIMNESIKDNDLNENDSEKIQEGLELFSKWFFDLWW